MNVKIGPQSVWSDILTIRKVSPLIHNITNYVVMENTANALLAIGASPVMAHAVDEVEDIVKIASSLVLNIGTLSPLWIQAMLLALQAANTKKIPVILDPVGVGATPYRNETVHSILNCGKVTVIRGNASEIATIAGNQVISKGVDSVLKSADCRDQAKILASKNRCVVWMSGETDIITDGNLSLLVHNGHPLMSKVTGMGCMATAVTGAFLAINPNVLMASTHAALFMGVVGEVASAKCRGPGSFQWEFLDALYSMTLDSLEGRMRLDIL